MSTDRVTAPLGRRELPLIAHDHFGAYHVLRCADRSGPAPQAGQFYMLMAGDRWGGGEDERPYLPRAFSVLRALSPDQHGDARQLHFLIEDVGPGTHRLVELGEGDSLLALGPLGHGFRPPRDARQPLLVGGGVGIAPLAIWQDELRATQESSVLLGFRDAAHAAGGALLHEPCICTDDGSAGRRALVTELLIEELGADPDREVYACGPPPMLEAVAAICAERKVPAQLALESGMACGYGACFGCVVSTRRGYIRLCLEGPVLEACELAQ